MERRAEDLVEETLEAVCGCTRVPHRCSLPSTRRLGTADQSSIAHKESKVTTNFIQTNETIFALLEGMPCNNEYIHSRYPIRGSTMQIHVARFMRRNDDDNIPTPPSLTHGLGLQSNLGWYKVILVSPAAYPPSITSSIGGTGGCPTSFLSLIQS